MSSATPVAALGLSSDVSVLASGFTYSCAIKGEALYCWEVAGNGRWVHISAAVRFSGRDSGLESGVTDVAVGVRHVCAIKNAALYCFGENTAAQLGIGR